MNENGIRANYAALLLCIEYIELDQEISKAISIIKDYLRHLPKCPIFYWMASLLSWRYSKVIF